jgi:hypothetical protein
MVQGSTMVLTLLLLLHGTPSVSSVLLHCGTLGLCARYW